MLLKTLTIQFPNRLLTVKLVSAIITLQLACSILHAQVDPHFSQYYIQPAAINPAFTGAIEADYRVSTIWRTQYSNQLSTKGLTAEGVTGKNASFGINMMNTGSSDGAYNHFSGYASMAYTGVRFGNNGNKILALGFQIGLINTRFNIDKLQFGSQWTAGVGYDPGSASGESFKSPHSTMFDAGFGIMYYESVPDKSYNLYGGIAVSHIGQPNNPFLNAAPGDRMHVKYSVQAGVRLYPSDLLTLIPNFIFVRQEKAQEINMGIAAPIVC